MRFPQFSHAGDARTAVLSARLLPVTPETTALVKNYRFREVVTQFRAIREGRESRWYAIPLVYQPCWDERSARQVEGDRDD